MSTVSEKIVELRKTSNMTQAELGNKLNISAQAVSKWEKGLSEPDIETLKKMCDIFNVSMDDMTGVQNKAVEKQEEKQEVAISQTTQVVQPKREPIAFCDKCHKPLYYVNDYIVDKHIHSSKQTITCKDCLKREEHQKNLANYYHNQKNYRRSWIWGSILGIVALVALIITGVVLKMYVLAFVGGIIAGYAVFAFTTQMFWDNSVSDCMLFFLDKTIQMPGVIFTLDLDGIIWLITVKLALWILSVVLIVGLAALGFVITSIYAMFDFPFALRNKKIENDAISRKALVK